jgi:2,3-bisphosphoglycerate-dependent phosphoglycerate mutase
MKVRTIETLSCILDVCKKYSVPTEHCKELNERDYGEYTGKNKEEMHKLLGDEEYAKIHRGWDYAPPGGESLKMVYERAVPFYLKKVSPLVNQGKNVLVVGHGNSLRSIVKYIESIPDEKISEFEFPFGSMVVYEIDENGKMINKEIRKTE